MSAAARGREVARADVGALALAVAGLALGAFASTLDARAMLLAWLEATTITLTLALGALATLTIGIVARASWPLVVRRPLEAIAGTLPLQALLFLPVALAPARLYPWAMRPSPLDAEALAKVEAKRAWLDVPFWQLRAALCFALWITVAALLRRASRRQDDGSPEATGQLRAIAAGSMPPLAITLTVAAFDWLMSLEPAWSSNAYGLYLFVAALSAALALVAVLYARLHAAAALPPGVGPEHAHALGNLLFASVLLWAYVAFTQLLIVWLADLPGEIVWYLRRGVGGFGWLALAVALLRFGAPFLLLLSRPLKRRPGALAVVAALVLVGHALDVHWLLAPSLHARPSLPWRELAALAATGGATFVAARRLSRGRAPHPTRDPGFAGVARLEMP